MRLWLALLGCLMVSGAEAESTTASVDSLRASIRTALQQGNLSAAEQDARQWWQLRKDAASCFPELLDATGQYGAAVQARKQLKAPPPAAPPAPAKLGAKAFVAASSLALRQSASPTSAVLMRLPIGTPVDVLEQGGAFARVRAPMPATPVRVIDLDPFAETEGEAPPPKVREVPASPAEGFVAAAFLASAPPDPAALEKQSRSADPAGRLAALERLAALRRERDLFATLAAAAFDAGQCSTAVHAARFLAGRDDTLGGYDVEAFLLVYGCRGDRAKAQFVVPTDKELARKKPPGNSCAINIDPFPDCAFCPLAFENPEGPQARKEQARLEKEAAATEQRVQLLTELYGQDGPYLRVRLRRRAEPTTQLFVVRMRPAVEGCGEASTPASEFSAVPFKLPEVKPGEAMELWVRVPEYSQWVYGVLPASAGKTPSSGAVPTTAPGSVPTYRSGGRFVGFAEPFCCCD